MISSASHIPYTLYFIRMIIIWIQGAVYSLLCQFTAFLRKIF